MGDRGASAPGPADPAALAALVLDEEARRHAAHGRPERTYADEDLMVVGGDDVSLAGAFRQGGVSLLVALMAVAVVQSLDNVAMGVAGTSLIASSTVLRAIDAAMFDTQCPPDVNASAM